jgi:hypothetical protein
VRNLPAVAPQPLPIDRPLSRVAPVESLAPPAPAVPALAPAPSPVRNLPAAAPQPLPIDRPLGRVAPVESLATPESPAAALAPTPAPVRNLPAQAAQPVPVESPALNRVMPVDPVSLPAMATGTPALQSPPEAPPGVPTATGPSTLPAAGVPEASGSAARAPMGAPDAGASLGHDVATAPSSPASAPRLNLDLARPRGGEISRQGSRGVFSLLPHPPESKLANDIEKSAKPDCRNAYSGLGLLAAVPLALDAVRKDGCRW